MERLIGDFEKSLFDCSESSLEKINEIKSDMLKVGIDSVLSSDLIGDIPIVGTLYHFGKFAQNIYDRNLMQQTIVFISELNNKKCDPVKVSNYRKKLKENPDFAEAELGRVLILLNKNIDIEKSKIMAGFYSGYINGEIDWDCFCELCDILDRLFMADLPVLKEVYNKGGVGVNESITYNHDRMLANGLLRNITRIAGNLFMTASVSDSEKDFLMNLTKIGETFCRYAFNNG